MEQSAVVSLTLFDYFHKVYNVSDTKIVNVTKIVYLHVHEIVIIIAVIG